MITLDKAYEILGVSPDASDDDVKKAYRKQAAETHPDAHPDDPYATVKFQLLQEAKATIDEARKNSHNNARTEYQNQSTNQNTYSQHNNSSQDNSSDSHSSYNNHSYNDTSYNNEKNSNGGYSNHTGQSNFAKYRSDMLKFLDEIYSGIKKNNYRNIESNATCFEIAYKCAYGALLRHALECILHDKAKEINIIPEGRSSDELLTFIIDNYFVDGKTKDTFYDAKSITNKLTHIKHFSDSKVTFESCQEFYNQRFKQIIESHLSSNKKRKQVYLRKIYDQLENFNIKNRITSTLLLGSVMRQILECIVDLWLYNQKLLPEDDRITIKDKLYILNEILRNPETGRPNYTFGTINNLHSIRKAVNQAMHVAPDNVMNISKIRSVLMAHTNILDFELEMPTDSPTLIAKERPHWWKILIWIFFFPILIPVKIAKSNMRTLMKFILIFLLIWFYCPFIIFGVFNVTDYIKEKTSTVITIDVEEMSNQLISGYNNHGYFSKDEYCKTVSVKKEEYVVTIKKDNVDEDGIYFVVVVDKNNVSVGKASIKAVGPETLYNGGTIDFEINEQLEDPYRIKIINNSVSVTTLEDVEISDVEFYATKSAEINSVSLDRMKATADAVLESEIADWVSPDTCKGANFVGTYFLNAKDKENEPAKNILFLIYKIDVITTNNSFSYYWYLRYNNVTVLPDGSASIDYQDYEIPSSNQFFGSFNESFTKDNLRYEGYETLDDFYNNCIAKIINRYTVENNVNKKSKS